MLCLVADVFIGSCHNVIVSLPGRCSWYARYHCVIHDVFIVKNRVMGGLAQAAASNTHSTHKEKLTQEYTKRDGGQNVFFLVFFFFFFTLYNVYKV